MTAEANHPDAGGASARSAQTRGRLLAAATEAFAERGFHGTTTRDIASAAGMSPAAVYVHYRSKEELLFELSHHGHLRTIALLDDADRPDAAPPARIAAVMRAFAHHHAEDHTGARIVNYELAALAPDHRDRILALRREITARVRAVVDSGIASGDFAVDDPASTTTALLSMGIDIARWYSPRGALTPDALADFYAGLALRIVGVATPRGEDD
ncbi:TetR/AcrR family transcriptional regulator [Gordonia shandongensis]|uniref:TetR/AcrR family transcriptional regulator n=1 Tax=Gordonia shandongensis TaxID=376351 RepID=UPI0003FE6527|nr:TetR/AcrR family transcriptional regulator [Gordonia shandongensis]